MFFNSIDFAVFLPIVFILYWFFTSKNLKIQNALILLVSYIFYGWWDWRFLFLIAFSTVVDYSVGLALLKEEIPSKRKLLLWVSIITNLGFLVFFKYSNFFVASFVEAFSFFGNELSVKSLKIILPVGISFYTFQTMSYTIDVYKKKLEPCKDFIAFGAFVSFFPQLVAGPIERATHLLPQFYKKRKFDYALAMDGSRQILWGLFKKMVIADNCAAIVNQTFDNYDTASGSTLLLAAILFSVQIYGDFSGYSDIAIGVSRLFGFDLMQNFAFPYFSRDIAEFWRRWHISLSTWFRDYLYIPLGGSRGGTWMRVRNTFIIFLVSGFWHGPNWTFIVWGGLNAIFFLPLLLSNKNRANTGNLAEGKMFPSIKEILSILMTFGLTTFAWIFFRADTLTIAFKYIGNIFSPSIFSKPMMANGIRENIYLFLLLGVFFLFEYIGRNQKHALQELGTKWNLSLQFLLYFAILYITLLYYGGEQEFIYFQF